MGHRIVLGFVGAVFELAILTGCGGDSQSNTPTTGAYAPIRAAKTYRASVAADPDSYNKGGADALSIVRSLGNSHYQLVVSNTSATGFINSFTWVPPPEATIAAVTGSSSGHCELSGGLISCRLVLRPPTCTCNGSGGRVTIGFIANLHSGDAKRKPGTPSLSRTIGSGNLRIGYETPVPYIIPSTPDIKTSAYADLPFCTNKGNQSTAAKPCIQHG